MKRLLGLLLILIMATSCNVNETIVFNEDGTGEFLMSFDMGDAMTQIKSSLGGDSEENSEKKKAGKIMDTTLVFSELMETHKDSISELPEEKQKSLEAIKDMYVTMNMNEDEGKMKMGVGMKFASIKDLKDIQEKVKKAQNINGQAGQIDMMKSQSPLGKFSGDNDSKTTYTYEGNEFKRVTTLPEMTDAEKEEADSIFESKDEKDNEFMTYFENSFYSVKLVFPKKIKSINIQGAEISKDRKTVTYKSSWMDYIKDPKSLDATVTFHE